jgi:cephalosporin-C deacetylase-like acetyl esterase
MKRALLASLGLLVGSALAHAQSAAAPDPARLFDYDRKQPLDIQEKATYDRNGVRVIDLSYASPRQGRVTAFLVLPRGKGPFAAILFGHWGGGNRTEFLPEAELYAQAGAISLLMDYPWTRPAPWSRSVPNMDKPELDMEIYSQAVVDLRRGLDLLLARPDVDPKRVAYVGHSYGAQWGAILSAVDRRMKTTVLVGGTPTLADVLLHDSPDVEQFVKTRKAQVEKYIEANKPLDAVNFIPRAAPIPLLFQFARFEQYFSRDAMDRYIQAASEPKWIKWYDTGHDLNDVQTLLDRAEWLEKQIGIKPLGPVLEKQLQGKPP